MRISDWSSDVCSSDLRAPPGVGSARTVLECLGRDPGERPSRNTMIVHIALNLQGEELGRQHKAGIAVPLWEPIFLWIGIEGAARMLIKPYRQSRVKLTGLDRPVRRQHGRTTGCAAIRYIYEMNSRETHSRHQGIGNPRG